MFDKLCTINGTDKGRQNFQKYPSNNGIYIISIIERNVEKSTTINEIIKF